MEIQITENTRIIADDKNYIVQKRAKCTADSKMGAVKGEWGAWKDDSYYQDWEHLMEDMLHLKIRQSDAKTLQDIVNLLNEVKTAKSLAKTANNKTL